MICSNLCDAPSPAPAPRWGRAGGTGWSTTPTGKVTTRTEDEVSRTVSERTCRGITKSKGKGKQGKESNGRSLPSKGSSSPTCSTC